MTYGHGTRGHYKRGCRCLPGRGANAGYMRQLRGWRVRGRHPLGARIPAAVTWKRLRQMIPEFGSEAEIARRLGLQKPELQLHRRLVTVRNALKVARLWRLTMLESRD